MRENGVSWGATFNFVPGAFGSWNTVPPTILSDPFGEYTSTCYDWWYPSAWDSTGSEQYDYAVFDFRPCGNPTINAAGWMGITVNQNDFGLGAGGVELDGYPGPPLDACAEGYAYDCGQEFSGDVRDSYQVESDGVSSTAGQSGGPWWQEQNNSPQVCGTDIGEESYADPTKCGLDACYRDYGHLIDTPYWNFIQTYTEL